MSDFRSQVKAETEQHSDKVGGAVVILLIIFVSVIAVVTFPFPKNGQPLRLAFPHGYTANTDCLAGEDVITHQPANESEVGGAKISDKPGGTLAGGKVLDSFSSYEDGQQVHLKAVGWVDLGTPDPRLAGNSSPERQGRYWFYVFSDTDSRHGWVVDAGIDNPVLPANDPFDYQPATRLSKCQLHQG